MQILRCALVSVVLATRVATALPSVSFAQSTAPTEAGDPSSGGLEEIVVTARRREESLQTTPVAITAFSDEDLRKKNIVVLEDLRQHTPGFEVSPSAFGSNAPSYSIRSQLQLEPTLTLDPSVGVYFAEVVQGRAYGTNSSLYDLDSVQVLKGPQGTLFGRNTTGGAVVLTPKAPTNELEGYVSLTAGNYGALSAEGALNLPFSDKLQVRIATSQVRRDGYTYNVYNSTSLDNRHTDDYRLSVHFKPTDYLDNSTVVHVFEADEAGTGFKLKAANPAGPAAFVYGSAFSDNVAYQQTLPFHDVDSGAPAYTRIHATDVSNVTTFDLGESTNIKNIFGYRRLNTTNGWDFDGTPFPVIDSSNAVDANEFSEELQLNGKASNNKLAYIAGLYFLREAGLDEQHTNIFGGLYEYPAHVDNKSKSVFAQATYELPWIDGLSVTLGGRYTKDSRQFTSNNTVNGQCAITVLAVSPSPCAFSGDVSFGKFTYTGSIDYKWNANHLVYVATRSGYRAGGWNVRGGETMTTTASGQVINTFGPFKPENVTDYEIGSKNEWFLGRQAIRANVAAYHTNYRNIQRIFDQQAIDPVTGLTTFLTYTGNAATAKIDGAEVELIYVPTAYLELGASLSYSHARYQVWMDPVAGDLTGNHFALSPERQFTPYVTWTQPLPGDLGKIISTVNAYYQSTIQFTDRNEPGPGSQGAYTLANARVTWSGIKGRRVDASFFINNIFNRDYYVGGVTIYEALGTTGANPGPPRMFGFTVRYSF